MITLGEYIIEKQQDFPEASGELSSLLSSILLATKVVNREINKAGLVDIIGATGVENIQGEVQQKMDLYANETFKAALEARGEVCGIASEEEDEFIIFDSERGVNSKYHQPCSFIPQGMVFTALLVILLLGCFTFPMKIYAFRKVAKPTLSTKVITLSFLMV